MTFTIGILHFHCKIDHKQFKWDKIKRDMYKSDNIYRNLKSD